MKRLSILVSIIVGIASVLLFRDSLTDIATSIFATVHSYTTSTTTTANQDNINQQEAHKLVETNMSVSRAIRKVFLAIEQAEGAGARVRRSIGTPSLRNLSPFLMLDHFSIKPGAGFPDQ